MLPTTRDKKSQPRSRVLPALGKEIGNEVDNPQSTMKIAKKLNVLRKRSSGFK